jgi:Tfp pilus assembly PilM family ATPase
LLVDGSGSAAVLDLGWSSASMFVVRHGVVIYERPLPDAGMKHLEQALAKQFDSRPEVIEYFLHDVGFATADQKIEERERLSEAASAIASHFEGVLKDLSLSVSYAVHQYPDAPMAKLLLIGPGAEIPGVAQHLGRLLGIEARAVAPGHLVECAPGIPGSSNPIFTTALGLALAKEY